MPVQASTAKRRGGKENNSPQKGFTEDSPPNNIQRRAKTTMAVEQRGTGYDCLFCTIALLRRNKIAHSPVGGKAQVRYSLSLSLLLAVGKPGSD